VGKRKSSFSHHFEKLTIREAPNRTSRGCGGNHEHEESEALTQEKGNMGEKGGTATFPERCVGGQRKQGKKDGKDRNGCPRGQGEVEL